jgi:L-alanine-DL-glutamate epimerase-like enolase superfamily enzyme
MMHFVSAIPNPGPFHEFKGFNNEIPFVCPTSSLESKEGTIFVPSGPGTGIVIDKSYVDKHTVVK